MIIYNLFIIVYTLNIEIKALRGGHVIKESLVNFKNFFTAKN